MSALRRMTPQRKRKSSEAVGTPSRKRAKAVRAWGFKRNGKLYPYAGRTHKGVESAVCSNPSLWGDIFIVRVKISEVGLG